MEERKHGPAVRTRASRVGRDSTVAIIGGGVAGLTAGIYLAEAGVRVELFERCDTAGGNLCGWYREGTYLDNCIHWLTGTRQGGELYRLWEHIGALGAEVEVCRLPFLYRSCGALTGAEPGATPAGEGQVTFSRSPATLRDEMLALSVTDRQPIEGWYTAVSLVAERLAAGGGVRSFLTHPCTAAALLPYLRQSLGQTAARFQHPLLRAALCDYLPGSYATLGLLLAYATFVIGNGDIPRGGSAAMARRITDRFRQRGGVLHTGCRVTRAVLEGGRVRRLLLENGACCDTADAVILATDTAVTFGELLPCGTMPQLLRYRYRHPETYPVFSAVQLMLRVAGDMPFAGTCAFPVRPYVTDGAYHSRLTLRSFSHEPAFSPPGTGILSAMLFQRQASAADWIHAYRQDRAVYQRRKEGVACDIMTRLQERYPALQGRLSLLDAVTPASYQRYLGAYYGAFLPFAMTGHNLPLPVPRRPCGVENAWLAGQWLSLPGGLPTAAQSGRAAAEAVLAYLATGK